MQDARTQGFLISRKMTCSKFCDLLDYLMISHATFKALSGWIRKLMKSPQLTSRAVNSLNLHDPVDIHANLKRFALFMRNLL